MNKHDEDTGTIKAMMDRLNHFRLPRALDIHAKVESGGLLDGFDIEFLHEVFEDATAAHTLYSRHPEIQDIAAHMISLYHHITELALANEQIQLAQSGTGGLAP